MLMTDVLIAGIGQTEVGEHWNRSLRELAFEAVELALQDAAGLQPQALFVGNMLAPQLSRQAHVGALLADYCGLNGIEAVTVEASGASGGAALRAGYMAVASGMLDVALVIGVEKLTDLIGNAVESAQATSGDGDYEAVHGVTPTSQAALLMRRYLYEYNVPRASFAGFALNSHLNGAGNSKAMFRKAISLDAYTNAGTVSDPLNMFDVSPQVDGAASLLLVRANRLPAGYSHPVVRIAASSMATDTLALHDRPNPLSLTAARISIERACEKAKVTPLQMDLFELYDSYSIFSALLLEAAGYAAPGEGWKMARSECIGLLGSVPISTMGGLKARGNPGGATGVYQAVEAVLQLRGQAGKNQIPEARRAMIQSLGGPASTAVPHILEAA
jgi:acetyl-CoA C-acetyltransferase